LLIPERLAKKLEVEAKEETVVEFGNVEVKGKLCHTKVIAKNPKTGERRKSVLETIVLPDEVLDVLLLGVVGQGKLRVIPRTTTGEPVFG
jgi:hypothetical protein